MLYVRMSLMKARLGHEQDVARIMDELVSFYSKQEGYVDGYKLRSADDIGDIGRITIWRSGDDADAVAQSNHVLATRSRLSPLTEIDSHMERSFYAEEESKPLAHLLHKLGL